MKNINVLIGLRRLRNFTETATHPAPNQTAIDRALAFVEETETPLEIVKVGLNEGFPVLYYTKSHKNNIARLRITDTSYLVKNYQVEEDVEEEFTNPQDAAECVVKAIESYVEQQASMPERPYNKRRNFRRRRFNDESRPSFRHGRLNDLSELGDMVLEVRA